MTQRSETFMPSLGPVGVFIVHNRRQGHTQNEDTDGEPTTRQAHTEIPYRT
jgi:hypothetical protein